MCSKAQFIASVVAEMINIHDDEHLERFKKKLFYTAPEICNQQWIDLFNYVRIKYSDDAEICDIYNKGYKSYVEEFS